MDSGGLLVTVVVAVKGDRRVYRLVESLLDQTVPRGSYEVLVVENGTASFADVARPVPETVRYVQLAEANMAAARNAGLSAARGCYLLLTDADCVAASDWIEQMSRALAGGAVAAVGGAIRKLEPTTMTQRHGITVVDGQRALSYLPALPLPYVAGANAGYVTAALREVGGFDEAFKSGNDVDICYQLGLRGHAIGLAPEAVVFHEDRPSAIGHFQRFRGYAVYQVLLFAKYRPVSGKRAVVNGYPFRRLAGALAAAPAALARLLCGDSGPAAALFLQVVEAAGVWCGDIAGSLRYRQLYL
jgi:GT2 family glycosyltransferase